jgi:hypothetical protein
MMDRHQSYAVMPALVAGIHALLPIGLIKTWMAGSSPAMTKPVTRYLS